MVGLSLPWPLLLAHCSYFRKEGLAPPAGPRASLQVPVFQVAVFKGETLLFALAPFLIVKVDVSALDRKQKNQTTVWDALVWHSAFQDEAAFEGTRCRKLLRKLGVQILLFHKNYIPPFCHQ